MSQTLHTSDYMSIFGDITESQVGLTKDSLHTVARLNLHFSIQVNGKMKSFTHFLDLEKTAHPMHEWETTQKTGYDLKDWKVWYAIVETLGELGYPIGDYNRDQPLAMNFIRNWIDDCTEALQSPDTFYR